jgi:hypothetical protein
MPPDTAERRPGGGGVPDDALGGGTSGTTLQQATTSGRDWRQLYGPALDLALIRRAERRRLVLAHPDLAARLTRLPLAYTRPDQWTGFVPPRVWRDQLNTDPRRLALAGICAEALHRCGDDCPALDVT